MVWYVPSCLFVLFCFTRTLLISDLPGDVLCLRYENLLRDLYAVFPVLSLCLSVKIRKQSLRFLNQVVAYPNRKDTGWFGVCLFKDNLNKDADEDIGLMPIVQGTEFSLQEWAT